MEDINNTITGYASVDRPWLKYYPDEIINSSLPESSIYEYLWENNKDHLSNNALSYFSHKISFGVMFHNIESVAGALYSIGVRENDIVTIFSINTPETIYCIYALNLLGAISNLEYITESEKEAISAIKRCKSKIIIILDALLPKFRRMVDLDIVEQIIILRVSASLPPIKKIIYDFNNKKEHCKKGVSFDKLLHNKIGDFEKAKYQKDKTAVIVHSGGTTGVPKGVELTNDNLNYIAWAFKTNGNDTKRGDTWLCAIPLFHAFGLAMGIVWPLCQGMQLVLAVQYNDYELVRLFIKSRPNHIIGSGAHVPSIQYNKRIQKMDLSFFRTCGLGGTPLTVEKELELVDFLERHNSIAKASIGYGMSETSSAIATELNRYYGKSGGAGILLCKSNVKVLDVNNEELPYNQTGELCFSGPGIMSQYYHNEEETKNVFLWINQEKNGFVQAIWDM